MSTTTEREQITAFTDRELVAYWNILQTDKRMLSVGDDGGKAERHEQIVGELLTRRGIPHEAGKRITQAEQERV